MGADGDPAADAQDPAIVYAGGPNQYMVAWNGDHGAAPLVDNENEIFGTRIAAQGCPDIGVMDFVEILAGGGGAGGGDGGGFVFEALMDLLDSLEHQGPCP